MNTFFEHVRDNDIIVLSYSIYDAFLEQILALANKKICFFHGVTPPELLEAFEPITAELCRKSIAQYPLLEQCDVLIANSQYTAKMLSSYVNGKNIEVLFPVFPTRQFNNVPATVQKDAELFIIVGRVVPHKKIEDSIFIFSKALKQMPESRLVIIGEAPNQTYNDFLKDLIDDFGISKSVDFVGKLDDNELKEYYQKAQFLINASLHEGYGIPVLEALYHNVFPIVRGGNAMEEIVSNFGYIFDDPQKVAIDFKQRFTNMRNDVYEQLVKNSESFLAMLQKVVS